MTADKLELRSRRAFTPEKIGRLDALGELGGIDTLAQHILHGRIHRDDLFDGLKPKTPLEVEKELK